MTSLGPVSLPVVLALLSLAVAWLAVRFWPRPAGLGWRPAAALLVDMFLLGLVGGRALFVLRHLADYTAAPWSVLRIGDGGFDALGFFAVAAAWAAWRLRATPTMRPALLAAALLGAGAWLGGTQALQYWQARHVRLPALVMRDLQGTAVPLPVAAGRPVVVNLWASWCGPCVREMPVLAKAQQREDRVRFVFVNQGEDAATVDAFLRAHAPTLQGVLLDEASATSQALGVQAYPGTLFFDGEGRLRDLHLGELTAAGLEHKLRRLR